MQRTNHRGIYFRIGKDGRKTYYLRAKIGGHETRRAMGPHLADALQIQTEMRANRAATHLGIVRPTKMTFGYLAGKYLDYYHRKSKQRNWARVKSIFKQLVGFFGSVDLKNITPWTIENYIKRRQNDNLSSRSLNTELDYLRAAFNRAVEWGFLPTRPRIKNFPIQRPGRPRALTDKEIEYILGLVSRDHEDAILLAVDTGMRLIELFLLKKEDWDEKEHVVELTDTKNLRSREIPLTPRVERILKRRFVEYGGRLFRETSSGRLSYRFHRERRLHVDIPPWRFHDLRHTFVTRLLQRGVDPYTVCELAGHSKLEMTTRYAHTTLDRKRAAIAVIGSKRPAKMRTKR
jgi:integrase